MSYLGDAEVGERRQHRRRHDHRQLRRRRASTGRRSATGAFIGVDTMLVAPREIGDGARTGAGAVVTRDVPAGKLAVGVPARIREPRAQAATPRPDGRNPPRTTHS